MGGTALTALAALLVAAGCSSTRQPSTTTTTSIQPTQASPAEPAAWPTYQGGNQRLGAATEQPPLTPIRPAWNAPLDGAAVYGQPLFAGDRVIVATEADDVYALNPHDGSVEWTVHLGTPLRDVSGVAGCGNVDPLGITSTPVVDTATNVAYVVGEVSTGGAPPVRFVLTAIDIRTGRVIETVDAGPPLPSGEDPVHLLQRAALALGNGRVYVGYGGQYGDCGTYHGWLVAVPALPSRPSTTAFDVTPDGTGGAIWQSGAAPAIASDGSVYVSTGNPNSSGRAPWSESVVELPPALGPTPIAYFHDPAASGDLDLAAGAPVLLPNGDLFAAGKSEVGYVLRQPGLSEVAIIEGAICGSDPDGGIAFDAALDRLYVPCRDGGIQEVDPSTGRIGWHAGTANSTPVLVNGDLWALNYPNGTLQELDPASGRTLDTIEVGRAVANFATPTPADGLLLVPTRGGIEAFSGPAGPPLN